MKVSRRGLAEIAGHEGIVQMPYRDSVGVWTYGVGHTKAAGPPDPAAMPKGVAQPIADVMALFAKDIEKFEKRVNDAVRVELAQHEFDALVSFDFNTGGIDRAFLVKSLNAGNRAKAAVQFLNWSKPREIIPRRTAEQRLFETGEYGDGFANIYPATTSGKVLWGDAKRVRVLDYLDDESKEEPEKPKEDGVREFDLTGAKLVTGPGFTTFKWTGLTENQT